MSEEKSSREVLQEVLTNSLKPLGDRIGQLENKLGELTSRLDEAEQRGFRRGMEAVALAFEQNAILGEMEPIGRRIYNAFAREGLFKKEEMEEEELPEKEETEEEELPEPPYLHIISSEERMKLPQDERKQYFGWTEGKFAKLMEG